MMGRQNELAEAILICVAEVHEEVRAALRRRNGGLGTLPDIRRTLSLDHPTRRSDGLTP